MNLAKSRKKGEAGEKEVEEGKRLQEEIIEKLQSMKSDILYKNREEFTKVIKGAFKGLPANLIKAIVSALSEKDETADICRDSKDRPEPDPDLRDTERVPITEDIEEYFEKEVRPYNPDAWIDRTKTKIGYEIPFTRYFYKYKAPEKSEVIATRIIKLEEELAKSLNALFGDVKVGDIGG